MATRAQSKANGTASKGAPRARKQAKTASSPSSKAKRHDSAGQSIKALADKALAAAHVPEVTEAVAATVRAVKPAGRKARSAAAASTGKAGKTTRRRGTATARLGTGAVIGVAAAGLAAGLVANLGRKAAVQAPSLMAGDWMEALKGEHKAALALLDQLMRASASQPARRTMLLTQLKHALAKHAFTEENVIYPALREWGDKADADQLNHEHGYVKQWLYELEGMDKRDATFADKVADFRADLEKHVHEEEEKIFPRLHEALAPDKNKALTALANREGFKLA